MKDKPVTQKLDPELKALLMKKNVHRVGRGIKKVNGVPTGEEAWIISVSEKLPIAELALEDVVPQKVKGLVTDVVVRKVAKAKTFTEETKPRTDKWRPVPGGVSIAHYKVTAGTLGGVVYKEGQPYILSNNHILANRNEAEIGDPILQPGKADGGELNKDEIGTLYSFVPLKFEQSLCPFASAFVKACNFLLKALRRDTRVEATREETEANLVDCALAKPNRVIDVLDEILEIGEVSGVVDPELGMVGRKSGRTTALTAGPITEVDVVATVQMGGGKMAIFGDCFATDDISDPGDSGSKFVSEQNQNIGLLFAGSDEDTLYIKYSNVERELGLDR